MLARFFADVDDHLSMRGAPRHDDFAGEAWGLLRDVVLDDAILQLAAAFPTVELALGTPAFRAVARRFLVEVGDHSWWLAGQFRAFGAWLVGELDGAPLAEIVEELVDYHVCVGRCALADVDSPERVAVRLYRFDVPSMVERARVDDRLRPSVPTRRTTPLIVFQQVGTGEVRYLVADGPLLLALARAIGQPEDGLHLTREQEATVMEAHEKLVMLGVLPETPEGDRPQ